MFASTHNRSTHPSPVITGTMMYLHYIHKCMCNKTYNIYDEMLLLLTHTSLFAVVIVAPKLGRQKPEIHMLPLALISGLCLSMSVTVVI